MQKEKKLNLVNVTHVAHADVIKYKRVLGSNEINLLNPKIDRSFMV